MKEEQWLSKLDRVIDEVRTLLIKKHHDYGSTNLLRHGQYGIVVRIDDKTSRICSLLQQEERVKDEPLRATWIDIVGYALQALVLFYEEELLKDYVAHRNKDNDPIGSGSKYCCSRRESSNTQGEKKKEVRRAPCRNEKSGRRYS